MLIMIALGGSGCSALWAQSNNRNGSEDRFSQFFTDDGPLGIRLGYSEEDLLKKSNDSTYISCDLHYSAGDGAWTKLEAEIRVRGGFRRTHCQYTPLRLKIKKENAKGTLFESNREVKLVFPCLKSKKAGDNLIKEFLAYKIYETLSPYHFKTRLLDIELEPSRNGKTKSEQITGFMIQDDKSFETEHGAKEIERFIQADAQNEKFRITNALFQYMIGNTDFSAVYLHNEKLFYVDEGIVPVPYDFDMSGLVDASYSVVSQVRDEVLPITRVTNRLYRGYAADEKTLQEVRSELIEKEDEVYLAFDQLKPYFEDIREYDTALEYIGGFYEILKDDKKFQKRIVEKGRKD